MSRAEDARILQSAEQAYHAGRFHQAKALAEQVLSRRRKHLTALHIRGASALEMGFPDAAAADLEKCNRMRPDDPTILFRLAQARAGQGRYDDALKCLTGVIGIRSDYPLALAAKADILERLGDRDGARRLIEPYLESRSEDPHMGLIYAKILRGEGRHEEAAALADRELQRTDMEPATRWQLWFLLGWCREKLGDFDGAFEAFRRGNSILPAEIDLPAYEREMDHLMDVFSRDFVRRLPGAPSGSDVPIFVVGMPRSGSTLIEQIIDAHPRACGAGEISAMYEIVLELPRIVGSERPYPDCLLDAGMAAFTRIAQRYLKRLTAGRRNAARIVDKLLRNFEDLGLIAMLFPKSRAINCVRDPMDTCLSCYMQPLSPKEHAYASDLAALGRVHRLYERLMRHWKQTLDLPILDVQYEELIRNQERVSREIIDFCGLEWDDACLRFYESGRTARTLSYDQVRQPIYAAALSRHEKYDKHLGPLKDALAQYDR